MLDGSRARTLFPLLPMHDAFKADMSIPNAHFAETARIPTCLALLYPTKILKSEYLSLILAAPTASAQSPDHGAHSTHYSKPLLLHRNYHELKRRPPQHIIGQFL
jgi:hypothetical protein